MTPAETAHAPEPIERRPAPNPRPHWLRWIGQIAGFVIGLGLLAACVWFAFRDPAENPWEKLRQAPIGLVVGLIACSAVSLLLNGATFWLVMRPVKDLGFWNLQRLNAAANALNYGPLRPGLILRLVYHVRVDRLDLIQIGAWFASIAVVLLLVAGVLFASMIVRPEMDAWWAGLVAGGLVIDGLSTIIVMGHPLIVRHGRGADRMLRRGRVLWAIIGLRLADIGAFAGRMYCALGIVGIALPQNGASYVLMLALVALLAGLIPIRIGFREALVGLAASRFGVPESESVYASLALIESAGEALLYVPLGALSLLWIWPRLVRAE